MECHSSRFAIRALSGTTRGLSQTVSEFGSLSMSQKSSFTVATLGTENLDLRMGSGACDGSGHHFERAGTLI
jgi:hypothetical protein